MTIEYRKHKSGRQFARIEGETVLRVLHKFGRIELIKDESLILAHSILEDKEDYLPCPEQEFNSAYQEALQRIKEMKIL